MIESEKPISLKKKNASYPKFHPALKAAVVAEGQEAVWVEDDGSKLRTRRRAKLTKKLNRFLFRQKSEPIPEENESKPVHVLKSKVKKIGRSYSSKGRRRHKCLGRREHCTRSGSEYGESTPAPQPSIGY